MLDIYHFSSAYISEGEEMMINVITVDGPTAAGKTTVSRRIATEFRIPYLESGRAYRYVAHVALRTGVDVEDEAAVDGVAAHILGQESYQEVLAAADDQVSFLRSPEVTRAVSKVAAAQRVRFRVTKIIRSWAHGVGLCIVEGRDIGTTVFPDARVKIFLTASPEVRARRRHVQEPGQPYDVVLEDLLRRDGADSSRQSSPLVPADDAHTIDASEMTVDIVVGAITELCGARGLLASCR